jgi:hypothetical protein
MLLVSDLSVIWSPAEDLRHLSYTIVMRVGRNLRVTAPLHSLPAFQEWQHLRYIVEGCPPPSAPDGWSSAAKNRPDAAPRGRAW